MSSQPAAPRAARRVPGYTEQCGPGAVGRPPMITDVDDRARARRRMLDSRSMLLDTAAKEAIRYLEGMAERPVAADTSARSTEELRARLGTDLDDWGADPLEVVQTLADCAERGVVASSGPRFFGYVVGGTYPVGAAADFFVTVWDQFAATFDSSPLVSVAEEIALGWVAQLLHLDDRPLSSGFTTGSTMAHVTALATARHDLLMEQGWDVERRGLRGAPRVPVLLGEHAHVSVLAALQYLGLGRDEVIRVQTDEVGRMLPAALAAALDGIRERAIVITQAGEINTGCFDPFRAIAQHTRIRRDWLHVDGAFGLWAAASPSLAHLVDGMELADSWVTDAHKMLNVPYDCGIVLTAHPDAHRAAMTTHAPYTAVGPEPLTAHQRNGMDWIPEMARRGRGVPVWAVLKALGAAGLADLIDRCHELALQAREELTRLDLAVPAPVDYNQVLVDVAPEHLDTAEAARFVHDVITEIRREGTAWIGGTRWRGTDMLRISVANWSTTPEDIVASCAAIRRAVDVIHESRRPQPPSLPAAGFADLMGGFVADANAAAPADLI